MYKSIIVNIQLITLTAVIVIPIAAWLTHIIVCLQTAKYILLIAGALVFPVGIIHGIGIWFGVSW